MDEFEKIPTGDFCLAHLFTYRDIPGGIQGLGYKKTVCRKKWNKGFTTLLNHKVNETMAKFYVCEKLYNMQNITVQKLTNVLLLVVIKYRRFRHDLQS